jgi:VCBS repeat protein/FG-GAP repeat protein
MTLLATPQNVPFVRLALCAAVAATLGPALSAQVGGTWSQLREHSGPTLNSQYGYLARSLGDVNGDGVPDYLTTAPYADDAINGPAGRAFVISGADGSAIREHLGTSYGGRLGMAAAKLGDVNGDGIADYALGTPFEGAIGQARPGSVTAYSGATGDQLWQSLGEGSYWHFGSVIESISDLSGDGVPDLLVSAPQASLNLNAKWVGSVYLLSGSDGAILQRVDGQNEFEYFGSSLATPGDVNGDGTEDFMIASVGVDANHQGSVFVYSGASLSLLHRIDGQSFGPQVRGFGAAMSGIGDMNGDGFAEVAISSPREDVNLLLPGAGAIRIFSGQSGAVLHTLEGDVLYSNLGQALAQLDDFDGDGSADLAVGYPNQIYEGAVRVYSGRDARLLAQHSSSVGANEYGWSVADGGDLNGDGRSEILVGAIENLSWSPGPGSLHLMSWDPHLIPEQSFASAGQGGSFQAQIQFPISEAGLPYALLLSQTGVGPVQVQGISIPLTRDWMLIESSLGNYPNLFTNPTGVLNATSQATLDYSWRPGQLYGHLGRTYWASAVTTDVAGTLRLVSAAVPLTIIP